VAAHKAIWPHPTRPDARALLGTAPICLDTMILTSLVRVNRRQILTECIAARAHIPPYVDRELAGHAKDHPEIHQVRPVNGFGRVAPLDHAAMKRVTDRQRAWHGLAAVEAKPGIDRGEAECLELCRANGWPLVSRDWRAIADGPRRGITVFGASELLMLFVAERRCSTEGAWTIYELLKGDGLKPDKGTPLNDLGKGRFLACCEAMINS
jgi:hypothetical protein